MRHRTVTSTFGRSSSHRQAMLAALVCGLIKEKRIKTTLARAKSARQLADKMVTIAKNDTLAARRQAISLLRRKDVVSVLFSDIAPVYKDRAGGYARVTQLGRRKGDNSNMAIMDWVGIVPVDKKKKPLSEDASASKEKST